MSIWVGGVATLLLAVPAATRASIPPTRTPLLAAAVARFSTLALFAVAALIAAGVAQAIPELESLSDFTDTAFGRSLLAKIALLVRLLGLGAWNRQRARPRLAAQAERNEAPGRAGVLLRRSLRTELALMVAVLGVTAALVSYPPPASHGGRPVQPRTSTSARPGWSSPSTPRGRARTRCTCTCSTARAARSTTG